MGATLADLSRDGCLALDAADPLAHVRNRFVIPDDLTYLDGNSLGAMPAGVLPAMETLLAQEWGQGLIRSWQDAGWIDAPLRAGAKIAPLVGAGPGEVVVADSTSVNLYKLLSGALAARPSRRVVLTARGDFPTDGYIAEGLIRALGGRHELRRADDLYGALDADTAVLMLTHVDYRSGRMHDMAGLTRAAHAAGALVLWDLSHSAGAVPVRLGEWDVDLAVGCGYKFLNGGPGAPAYLYVRAGLEESLPTPLTGWMGHADPFEFADAYAPAAGVRRYLCGAPVILGARALESALDVWADLAIDDVRAKSVAMTELFIRLVDEFLGDVVEVVTPRDPALRGSQVTLRHAAARELVAALSDRGVLTDYRPPDLVRFGFAPLYVRFVDAWQAVRQLVAIFEREEWRAKQDAPRRFVP